MKIFQILVIFVTVTQRSETTKDTTLPLRERLALLKYQIARDINKNQNEETRYQSDASLEKIEYVDIQNQPITPINENDERKKHGRFHLRQLKTTTEAEWRKTTKIKTTKTVQRETATDIVADDLKSSSEEIPRLQGIEAALDFPSKKLPAKPLRGEKLLPVDKADLPSNIFYRRIFSGDNLKSCSKRAIHCTDLITPILTGQKVNITNKKLVTYNDHEVIRLLQLLSEDMSDLTKEEIYSSLYQISNLQIRLFQWNIASLKLLFNVITKGEATKRHTWKSLKSGLKRMLSNWHLDFSNVTNLLLQARIFRPPCIASNGAGSTKSSKAIRYTKKIKPRCEDAENSGSCEYT